jgi:hypothetical protein
MYKKCQERIARCDKQIVALLKHMIDKIQPTSAQQAMPVKTKRNAIKMRQILIPLF